MVKIVKKTKRKSGYGLLDRIIDKIPVELHLPSYQFCGPGDYCLCFFHRFTQNYYNKNIDNNQ